MSSDERKKILLDVADALEAKEDLIRAENEADVIAAQYAGYEKSLVARLTLKPGKVGALCNILSSYYYTYESFDLLIVVHYFFMVISFDSYFVLSLFQIASLAKSIRTLANMEDPINRILKRTEVTLYTNFKLSKKGSCHCFHNDKPYICK